MKVLRYLMVISLALYTSMAFSQEYGWQKSLRQQNRLFDECYYRNNSQACRRLGNIQENIRRQGIRQKGELYYDQVRKDIRRREEQQRYLNRYYRSLEQADQSRIQKDYPLMYRNYQDANQYKQWADELNKKEKPWYKFWD